MNQIFLRKLHGGFFCCFFFVFDYIKDNRRIGFSQVTTGHQSHMLEFVRKQGCLSQVARARARRSRWQQRAQLWSLNWQQRPPWKPGIVQMQFLAKRTHEAGSLQQKETYGRHHIGYQCFFRAHEVHSKWEVPSAWRWSRKSPTLAKSVVRTEPIQSWALAMIYHLWSGRDRDHCSLMKSPPGKFGCRTCVQSASSCFHAGGWLS